MTRILSNLETWLWVIDPGFDNDKHNARRAALIGAMPLIGKTFDGVYYIGPDRTRDHTLATIGAIRAYVHRRAIGRRLWNDATPDDPQAPFDPKWYSEFIQLVRSDAKRFGFESTWADTENYNVNGEPRVMSLLEPVDYARLETAVCRGTKRGMLDWIIHPLASNPRWYTHAMVPLGRRVMQGNSYVADPTVKPLAFAPGRESKCHAWCVYVRPNAAPYQDTTTWTPETFVNRFRGGVEAAIRKSHIECRRVVVYAEANEVVEVVERIANAAGVN